MKYIRGMWNDMYGEKSGLTLFGKLTLGALFFPFFLAYCFYVFVVISLFKEWE